MVPLCCRLLLHILLSFDTVLLTNPLITEDIKNRSGLVCLASVLPVFSVSRRLTVAIDVDTTNDWCTLKKRQHFTKPRWTFQGKCHLMDFQQFYKKIPKIRSGKTLCVHVPLDWILECRVSYVVRAVLLEHDPKHSQP